MATVKRPKGKKAEKDGSGDAAVTERDLWNLRTQLAAAEIRIDELEAQVFRLAHGGKEKEFFTVEETAEIWGVSRSALYVMIRDGKLPAVRIGDNLRIAKATLLKGTN